MTQQSQGVARSRVHVCMHVLNTVTDDVRVMREADALSAAGYDVTVVGLAREHGQLSDMTDSGVRVHRVRFSAWFVPSRPKILFLGKYLWAMFIGTARLARIRADIYHAHEIETLPACLVAARLHGASLVLDSHELPFSDPSVMRWNRLARAARLIAGSLIQRCRAIFTVSPPIAADMEQTYGVGPIHVLRNILPYQSVPRIARFHEQLGLATDTRIVLYQGLLHIGRGLVELVEAAPYLHDNIVVIIMGNGPLKGQLEALVAERGMERRVRLIPSVPYRELLTWTACADVGMIIYPPTRSKNEQYCLGNKFFEYIMAGVPIIATRLDAVQALIQRYDIGWVIESLAPTALASAVNELLADNQSKTRARMRANALAAAKHELNWELESRVLLHVYDRLAARPVRPGARAESTQSWRPSSEPI